MKRNLNHGGSWPAIRAVSEDGKIVVGNFRPQGPTYPNIDGMPERVESIDFRTLVAIIALAAVVVVVVGSITPPPALVLLWVACCGAAVRWSLEK